MTSTQKKIQKSSKILSIVFLVFLCSCTLQGLNVLWKVVWLLLNPANAMTFYSNLYPLASHGATLLHQTVYTGIWATFVSAFVLLYRIFRDISRQYTPFQQLHVRRLRWTAVVLTVAYTLEIALASMSGMMTNGMLRISWSLDPFLIPLTLIGLSYILDYACQLQNEADTTL